MALARRALCCALGFFESQGLFESRGSFDRVPSDAKFAAWLDGLVDHTISREAAHPQCGGATICDAILPPRANLL
jgi:hypothetical protein